MIRRLAQCPYCRGCEIALDDSPQLVFNPDTDRADPCPHLLRVEARYSQWDRSPQGVPRVVGSADCRWEHPGLAAADQEGHLPEYLKELVGAGPGWEFAPQAPFEVAALSAEERAKDARGHDRLVWEVDGEALFALEMGAFLAELPGCQKRHLAGLRVEPEDGQG